MLPALNATELAVEAARLDPAAHRDDGETVLGAVLNGERLPYERTIHKIRLRIMAYIIDKWEYVSPLLSCPARSKDPRACFACTDVQVAECVLTNPVMENEEIEMADTKQFGAEQFKTEAEWLELAQSEAGKSQVGKVLQAIGIGVQKYLGQKWTPEQRVAAIIEYQTANGWKPAGKASGKPAATVKEKAAPAAAREPAATTAAASGERTPGERILDKLDVLFTRLDKIDALLSDTHYGVRTLVVMGEGAELAASPEWHGEHFEALLGVAPKPKAGKGKGKKQEEPVEEEAEEGSDEGEE